MRRSRTVPSLENTVDAAQFDKNTLSTFSTNLPQFWGSQIPLIFILSQQLLQLISFSLNLLIRQVVLQPHCCFYTKRRQIMAKVTEWFFYYFLIFKLDRVAKLKFPTFPQSKSIANCSGQP